jgi:hypothetical protein
MLKYLEQLNLFRTLVIIINVPQIQFKSAIQGGDPQNNLCSYRPIFGQNGAQEAKIRESYGLKIGFDLTKAGSSGPKSSMI